MKQLQVFQVNLQPTKEQTKYQVDVLFLIWEITRCWIQRDRLLFKVSAGVNSILQLFTFPKKTNNPSHPSLHDLYLLLRAVPREKKTKSFSIYMWLHEQVMFHSAKKAALLHCTCDENTHNGQMSPTNLRNRLRLKNWNMSNFDTAKLIFDQAMHISCVHVPLLAAFGLNAQLGCVQTKCHKDLCPYAPIFKVSGYSTGWWNLCNM